MRTLYTLLICVLLMACGDKNKDSNITYLPASQGNLNGISVVIDNSLWDGAVGEKVRDIFAAPLNGLPVDEPMFQLHQVPPQVFDGFAKRNRIVLKIEKGNDISNTEIKSNTYARPQTVAVVLGKSDDAIISQLNENKAKLIDAFNKEEIKEKQRLIKKSLLNTKDIETKMGFLVNIPSVYRIAKAEDDFFWIRKNLSNSKTVEIMFYEVPIETISQGDSTIVDIVKMRNQITKTKIPGEDGIYMAVEDAYAPAMFKTIIDNKPTYEIRGLWDMKGFTMGGPFITYAIEDKVNKRYIIADGYVYAPSLNKSEYMFELEAMVKSIVIK